LDVLYVYFDAMQCNATGGLSLPSHDTLAVLTTQSTFILWEDDGEDKDDSGWVTDNNSVMSDDGESGE
jgi:hypothetical protein